MTFKSTPILLFLQFLSLFVSAQKNEADLLAQAYKTGNSQKLYEFCKAWQNELPPISNEELSTLSDTLKEAYVLFSEFWNSKYTRETWLQPSRPFKKDSSFIIVQNNLKVYIDYNQLYFSPHEIDSLIFTKVSGSLSDSAKKAFYTSSGRMDSFIVSNCPWPKKNKPSFEAVLNNYREGTSPYKNGDSINTKRSLINKIADFRPQLDRGINWLYWNKDKYGQINHLKEKGTKKQKEDPFNEDNIYRFLKKYLLLTPAYVQRRPEPNKVGYMFPQNLYYVSSITFDKNVEYAQIVFETPGSNQTFLWHRENNQWNFFSTLMVTLIQE